MMKSGKFFAVCICLNLFFYADATAQALKKLKKDIDRIIASPYLENASWGILVKSVKTDSVLYSWNPKKTLIPASNLKIFTSAFALDQLGPDFQYTTRVYLQGRFENDSTFDGNVIIRGMGDPTISGRFQENKVTKILEDWADSIRARKIKIIRGMIIGDDNFFGDDVLGYGWEWNDESYWYSAQISGLSFNDNCVNWYVSPTKAGQPGKIQTVPATSYIKINNRTETVAYESQAQEIDLLRHRSSNEIDAVGKIPLNASTAVGFVTVDNPTLYTAFVFKEILEKKNIHVDSTAQDIDDLKGFSYNPDKDTLVTQVASYTSPKFSEIVKVLNKRSQNLFAELALRTVAAVQKRQGTGDSALALERRFLEKLGIKVRDLVIHDGSGYSRTNQISPDALVTVLRFMRKHPQWKIFNESLPIAGKDGALKHRMIGTVAEDNVHAKTGHVDNVVTISGFLKTLDSEELVFSIMTNNSTIDKLEVEKIQDDILEALANFTRN